MKKLCIVGNSHLGALAKSIPYDLLGTLNVNVDFWGVAGKDFPNIKTNKAMLLSPNPKYSLLVSNNKFENLNIASFDSIWFHACHIEIFKFCKRVVDSLFLVSGLSQSFKSSFVDEEIVFWWKSLYFYKMYCSVASYLSNKHVFLSIHPLYSEIYLEQFEEVDFSEEYIDFFESVLSKIISFISKFSKENNIVFIQQPSSTIVKKIFTSDVYSKNSVKLATENKPHPDTDYVHMNESYGHILWASMLENFLPALEGKYTFEGVS